MQTNNYSVGRYVTIRISAFNTVVCWHKLGQVENKMSDLTLVYPLCHLCAKQIFTVGGNLTKFWKKNLTKIFFTVFLRHGVHYLIVPWEVSVHIHIKFNKVVFVFRNCMALISKLIENYGFRRKSNSILAFTCTKHDLCPPRRKVYTVHI